MAKERGGVPMTGIDSVMTVSREETMKTPTSAFESPHAVAVNVDCEQKKNETLPREGYSSFS